LDFTKGWVAMNAVQILSYQSRRNGNDDDFALIEQGGGDSKLEFAAFSLLSVNNLMRLENDGLSFASHSKVEMDLNLSGKFAGSEPDVKDEIALCPDSRLSLNSAPELKLQSLVPPKAAIENSSWINTPILAGSN
jgi:hypothetical protein